MSPEGRRRIEALVIAGPTASGKSALAVRLAERIGGTVINADSMQVYRDLRVLTARPDAEAEARVPHRLYGHVDAATAWSVSSWLAEAGAAIDAARRDGRVPMLVGGSGLYLKALTQGLSAIPSVPEAVRASVRTWAARRTPDALHAELAKRDPRMAARLRPSDPQRLARALEVHEATGRSLADYHETRDAPVLPMTNVVAVTLTPERAALRERIDRRFETMMDGGGLEEVEALAARELPSDLPAMRALGVPPLLRHLAGAIGLDEAVSLGQGDTRKYVKRQDTFARHQLADFHPVEPERVEDWLLCQLA